MRRRDAVLALLALGVAPLASFGQMQGKVWRVGFMAQIARPDPLETHIFGGLPRGLRELGYVESRNLAIEWRFGDSKIERLSVLAAELVQQKVDVIVAAGTLSAIAMQKATATIPVVFANISDPVASGIVKSLGRPGGNLTGVASLSSDIAPKVMEFLLTALPRISRVAILMNPLQPTHEQRVNALQSAAQKLGVRVQIAEARTAQEIDQAFLAMARQKSEALVFPTEGLFIQQRHQIVDLARKAQLPSASSDGEYAKAGGVLSYGPNQTEIFRRAASYVDKILKGAKPEDLPVEQPTTFELVINLRAAKGLGIKIPQSIVQRADGVIE